VNRDHVPSTRPTRPPVRPGCRPGSPGRGGSRPLPEPSANAVNHRQRDREESGRDQPSMLSSPSPGTPTACRVTHATVLVAGTWAPNPISWPRPTPHRPVTSRSMRRCAGGSSQQLRPAAAQLGNRKVAGSGCSRNRHSVQNRQMPNEAAVAVPASAFQLLMAFCGPPACLWVVLGLCSRRVCAAFASAGPACRAAVTHPARRLAVWAGPRRCFPVVGNDLRVALTGSGPSVGSGAIKMTARRRRSLVHCGPLAALLGGREDGYL